MHLGFWLLLWGERADEHVHAQVEVGVVELDGVEGENELELAAELLSDLAAQRALGPLRQLDLASGELPGVLAIDVSAFGCEYLVVVLYDGSRNMNGFHDSYLSWSLTMA